jgi:DTW domain-containing protein
MASTIAGAQPEEPKLCRRCLKPPSLCVCDLIETLSHRTEVLILQHPQEPKEYLGTARLVETALQQATVKTGLSWGNLSKVLGHPVNNKEWGVLFLGTIKGSSNAKIGPVNVTDSKGTLLEDGQQVLHSLKGIVALDGSWREAKALWWRNPWLLKLRRLVLNPGRPSLYGKLRREPRRESLSTLEAIGLALAGIEQDPGIEKQLLRIFEAFLAKARPERPPAVGRNQREITE